MDLNRNQFFFLGFLVLLVGIQFRLVSTYVLTPEATKILAERTGQTQAAASESFFNLTSGTSAAPRKVLTLPEWSGWCLISVGSVLVLHSLAMNKPG